MNNKIYIGQTKCYKDRMVGHKESVYIKDPKRKTRLSNAINKYSWNNFIHEIIIDNISIDLANDIEQYLISFYGSINKNIGFNIRPGGNNSAPTEESRKKMSEAKLGKKQSDETKRKRSESLRGRVSPMKGRKQSQKFMDGAADRNKGSAYMLNTKKVGSSSIYYGVAFKKSLNRWLVLFTHKRKHIRVGIYKTEIEAALAYNEYISANNMSNRILNVIIDS